MKNTLRILICAVGVLLVVAVIGFVITGNEPLYGHGNDEDVPDLIGTWEVDVSGYAFNDVTNPAEVPIFFEGPSEDIIITDQTGRVFAGEGNGDDHYTGVVLSDGTVTIQGFELTELRLFLTGTLDDEDDTLVISGYFHLFDDFGAIIPADTSMGSGVFQAVKVN